MPRLEPPVIPKGGMVETTYARLWARFGTWSPNYLVLLRDAPIPAHVQARAIKYRDEQFWLKDDAPKDAKPDAWAWLSQLTPTKENP